MYRKLYPSVPKAIIKTELVNDQAYLDSLEGDHFTLEDRIKI